MKFILTAMYAAQPALLVLALESTRRPLIPKSHSLIAPLSSNKMFEGFTSVNEHVHQIFDIHSDLILIFLLVDDHAYLYV